MKKYNCSRIVLFLIIAILIGICLSPFSVTQKINIKNKIGFPTINGQILFSPLNSETTYLIDATGNIINTWSSDYRPGLSIYHLNNGDIIRPVRKTYVAPAGAGGGVQRMSKDGTLLWDFNYYTEDYLSHHDIEPLPNGNILIIAWEYKTYDQCVAAGRNPDNIPTTSLMPDHIIEVKPIGPTSGEIVWKWHVWDHLIQDFDPSKDNYGVIEEHPELIDINYAGEFLFSTDWLHMNSIDYNQELDQIMVSVRNFNEIWIIDHSTTTSEAAGHTGGNSGKGGDLLYRWGNPNTYDAGNQNDQKLFYQHDASWIKSECPGEGNILIFNNGNYRPDGRYSSVDEIIPPVDENGNYYLEEGFAYGPDENIWTYTDSPPTDFFASFLSGAERLKDGNTLICDGPGGRFFEVTPDLEIVWEYSNIYPSPASNYVFKICYLPSDEPNPEEPNLNCNGFLSWDEISAGETVSGSFIVENNGGADSLLNWKIEEWPEWGTWNFNPESGVGLSPYDGPVNVEVTVIAPKEKNKEFEGYIKIINTDNPEDFEVIYVSLKTPVVKDAFNFPIYQFILKYLQKLPRFIIIKNYLTTT